MALQSTRWETRNCSVAQRHPVTVMELRQGICPVVGRKALVKLLGKVVRVLVEGLSS